MADNSGLKSSFELAMERLRQKDAEAGVTARVLTDVVHALAGGPRPLHRLDPRIVRALECIRASRDARLSLEQVAREVFLSPSRFAHLFSAEIGVPFRRYLLWRKLSTAMQQFGRGENLSAAAHSAGFADSAHLTRTWVRMFGMAPTLMVGQAEFYEIPAPFEFTTAASEVESG
jgi:AraC-like DNA-binding protein